MGSFFIKKICTVARAQLEQNSDRPVFLSFFLPVVFHTKRSCPCLAQPTWGSQGTKRFVSLDFADEK